MEVKEPDEESKNGDFFHAFLSRHGDGSPGNVLEAEVALGRTARGDGIVWTTWGLKRRAHGCLMRGGRSTGTLAVQEREDHRLVSVSLQWSLQSRAAPFPSCASGGWLCRPAVREAIEQKCRATPPMLAHWSLEMMERAFARRGRQALGRLAPCLTQPKELGGEMVGSSRSWPPEEHPLPGRSPPPCSPAQVHSGAVEGEQGPGDWN